LAAASCLLYFYPLVFFSKIIFMSEGALNSVPVDPIARASVLCGIVYLLISGLRAPVVSAAASSLPRISGNDRLQVNILAACVVLLMGALVAQNGVGLGGREKTELMENLGYLYKLFLVLSALLVSAVCVIGGRVLYLIGFAAVGLDMMFGFRGGLAVFIAAFFLTRRQQSGLKSIAYLVLGYLAVIFMIIAKESAYFTRDMSDVLDTFLDLFSDDAVDFLSIANPESASISAVYNEVISHDFSVPMVYLFDSIMSLFPFTGLIGFEAVGYGSYFKGVIFGAEGDSFASGMLAVAYSLGGFAGVAVSFYVLSYLGKLYNSVMVRSAPLGQSLLVAVGGIMLTSYYRSDLVYLVGIVRSLVVIVILLRAFAWIAEMLRQRDSAQEDRAGIEAVSKHQGIAQ
jgi:hypothetical protein